jgi:hypothetical protein
LERRCRERFFKKTVSTASLVTDQILAVLNEVGTRWIKYIPVASSAATADAPTDAAVFTADLNQATTSLKGLQSATDKTREDALWKYDSKTSATAIPDAPATTVQPITDGCSRYSIPGPLTQNIDVTIGNTGFAAIPAGTYLLVDIVRSDVSAHTVTIRDAGNTVMCILPNGTKMTAIVLIASNGSTLSNQVRYPNG